MKTIIVEDYPACRRRLEKIVSQIDGITLCGSFEMASQAIDFLENNHCELAFIDINLPDLSGFELIERLGDHCTVIVTTAHRDHAITAFRHHVDDFLLKPLSVGVVEAAVARLKSRTVNGHRNGGRSRFIVPATNRYRIVQADAVDVLQAQSNYVLLHSKSVIHKIPGPLKTVLAELDSNQFIRVHRSFAVRVDAIQEVQPMFKGDQILIIGNRVEVPVARSYRQHLMDVLDR